MRGTCSVVGPLDMQMHAQFMHLHPRILRYSASLLKQLSYILLWFHIALYSVCRYTGLHIRCPMGAAYSLRIHITTGSKYEFWNVSYIENTYSLHYRASLEGHMAQPRTWFLAHLKSASSCAYQNTPVVRRYLTLFHQTGDVKPAS